MWQIHWEQPSSHTNAMREDGTITPAAENRLRHCSQRDGAGLCEHRNQLPADSGNRRRRDDHYWVENPFIFQKGKSKKHAKEILEVSGGPFHLCGVQCLTLLWGTAQASLAISAKLRQSVPQPFPGKGPLHNLRLKSQNILPYFNEQITKKTKQNPFRLNVVILLLAKARRQVLGCPCRVTGVLIHVSLI